jgi:hypothetical protein
VAGEGIIVKRAIFGTAATLLAALTAACAEPPVKPIPDGARQSVTSVAADVSGVKNSDTSKVGARGSEEGSRLGALQGAATVLGNSGGSLLGLILTPVGAAVGSAKGAAEAQSAEVVDETRSNLRLALQETDFTGLLRQRLAGSRAGTVTFTTVTAGSASAATAAGAPVGHVIALEYRVGLYGAYLVNPQIGIFVQVSAQVQSADRRTLVHTATWSYCGDRIDFVQMGANNGALLRSQIDQAAMVLGEAIPYDLYASRQPRSLKATRLGASQTFAGCMDFSDLPSRTGPTPVAAGSRTPVPPTPASTTPAVQPGATPVQVASAAPAVRSPAVLDGNWQIEMEQLSTTYGTTVGGECPGRFSIGATFINGNAEWPRGKLALTGDGKLSGWINVPAVGTSMLPFIVNLSGNMDNAGVSVVKGTVSGRCTGSFTMRKQ